MYDRVRFVKRAKNNLRNKLDEYRNLNKIYSLQYMSIFSINYLDLPVIYLVTPTVSKETQIADLTRLRNTLLLVPKIVWIIIEDSESKTNRLRSFLKDSNVEFVHLNFKTLKSEQLNKTAPSRHKGIGQRNEALKWLRDKTNKANKNGVVFFADDDNVYDRRLFEEVRAKETFK